MDDVDVLPHGLAVAVEGLRGSVLRLRQANQGLLRGEGGGPIWIALSEALYWVAATDVHLGSSRSGYWNRRAADDLGQAVGGLVYARNFHTHELLSLGRADFVVGQAAIAVHPPGEVPPPSRGTIFSVRMLWRRLEDLPQPKERERFGKDLMYQTCVEGRPLAQPLDDAIDWFAKFVD